MKKKEESRVRSGTPLGIRESLKKAVTEMLVLFVLQDRPMYTYEISQQLEKLSDKKITFNTLYPAIYRLQGFGYIAEHESINYTSVSAGLILFKNKTKQDKTQNKLNVLAVTLDTLDLTSSHKK